MPGAGPGWPGASAARQPRARADLPGGPVAAQVCAHSTQGPIATARESAVRVGAGRECHCRRSPAACPRSLPPAEPPAFCDLGPGGWPGNPVRPALVVSATIKNLSVPDLHRRGPVRRIAHTADHGPGFGCQLDSTTLGNEFVTRPQSTPQLGMLAAQQGRSSLELFRRNGIQRNALSQRGATQPRWPSRIGSAMRALRHG